MSRQPCTYILASSRNGTLYIGVTSDLAGRLHQHRSGAVDGFTSRYRVARLVRFEMFDDMPAAIAREKQLKRWRREWKLNLIEQENPAWNDLAIDWGFEPLPACRDDGVDQHDGLILPTLETRRHCAYIWPWRVLPGTSCSEHP